MSHFGYMTIVYRGYLKAFTQAHIHFSLVILSLLVLSLNATLVALVNALPIA